VETDEGTGRLAWIATRGGRHAEAAELSARLGPKHLFNYGQARAAAGREAEAIDVLEAARRLGQKEVLRSLADLYLRADMPREAADCYAALPSPDVEDWLRLGHARLRAGEKVSAREAFAKAVFQTGAPYARVPGGSKATLETITLDDVKDWHRRTYSPANTTLLLVGDLTVAEARQIAQQALGSWSAPAVQLPPVANPVQPAQGTRVILVDRPGSVQSGVWVGQAGMGYGDPAYFPMLALSNVLGGAFKARINMNLRERHGWTYGAFTSFTPRAEVGTFAITSSVRTNATESAVAEAVREYRRMASEPVPAAELQSTVQNIVGSFPNTVQTVQGLTGRMEILLTYRLPLNFWSSYRERVAAVTAAELAQVGRQKLSANALTIVVAGDLSKIEAPIRALNLGTVEVWDQFGTKVR
jgi:hypothetical protein